MVSIGNQLELSSLSQVYHSWGHSWAMALCPQEKQDRIRHYAEILVPVKVGTGSICAAPFEMMRLIFHHQYLSGFAESKWYLFSLNECDHITVVWLYHGWMFVLFIFDSTFKSQTHSEPWRSRYMWIFCLFYLTFIIWMYQAGYWVPLRDTCPSNLPGSNPKTRGGFK